jgi:hypothetical protein
MRPGAAVPVRTRYLSVERTVSMFHSASVLVEARTQKTMLWATRGIGVALTVFLELHFVAHTVSSDSYAESAIGLAG